MSKRAVISTTSRGSIRGIELMISKLTSKRNKIKTLYMRRAALIYHQTLK